MAQTVMELLEMVVIEVPPGELPEESNSAAANCFDPEPEWRYWLWPGTRLETQPLVAPATEPEKRGTILRPESYQGPQDPKQSFYSTPSRSSPDSGF